MSRIIDLKNRGIKLEPANGHGFSENNSEDSDNQSSPSNKNESHPIRRESRVISWSGQLHLTPNVPAIIVASIIFFVIAILIQIFQKNVITTIFFALIGLVILLNIKQKHEIGRFEINPAGVMINDTRHTYSEIKSFWIEYDQSLGIQELSLQLKKWHSPFVKIPIYGQNPVQLRLALLEFLPEIEHKDSMVEILSRKLGI